MYLRSWKRFFDGSAAFLGLFVLAIPVIVLAVIIKATSSGPVFFIQERIGKDGKAFRLVKFRTMMTAATPASTITIAGDKRITPLGRVLRRFKLDEIPQLWNVLRGEMSLVGPRPDVPGYADRLRGEARRMLELRPGITGPSSLKYADEEELLAGVPDPIRYNDEVLFPDKVRINLQYLEDCSFHRDLRYLWLTLKAIF